jgi:hypothetical protein
VREALEAFRPVLDANATEPDLSSNEYRASRTLVPLAMYAYKTGAVGEPIETVVQDLLSDLLHLSDYTDVEGTGDDPHYVVVADAAEARYLEERAEVTV